MDAPLSLSDNTNDRLNKLLSLYRNDMDKLVNELINYKIRELRKGIRTIERDFYSYEQKYELSTTEFYSLFEDGKLDDTNNDYYIWSGEYETYIEFKQELNQLV
ncbi:MAG: hypothetical protein F6K17_08510 [Okeania sp. SIO3C4]|nr:hypothetical protein [Okeania sp. SIO3C4]